MKNHGELDKDLWKDEEKIILILEEQFLIPVLVYTLSNS